MMALAMAGSALVHPLQAQNQLHQGCLACTVNAKKSICLSLPQTEAAMIDYLGAARDIAVFNLHMFWYVISFLDNFIIPNVGMYLFKRRSCSKTALSLLSFCLYISIGAIPFYKLHFYYFFF